jgi:hypothetical protein
LRDARRARRIVAALVVTALCAIGAASPRAAEATPVTSSLSLMGFVIFEAPVGSQCAGTEPIFITSGTQDVRMSTITTPNGRVVVAMQIVWNDVSGFGTNTGTMYTLTAMAATTVTTLVETGGHFEATTASHSSISSEEPAPDTGYMVTSITHTGGEFTTEGLLYQVNVNNLSVQCP